MSKGRILCIYGFFFDKTMIEREPLRNQIEKIIELLTIEHGSPRHGNKRNPLNEYLYILLSLRTDWEIYEKVYREFKKHFRRWADVDGASITDISTIIRSAGLHNQKAKSIKKTLSIIKKDFDELSLSEMSTWDCPVMEKYLSNLPGIGLKGARCIMLYSFNRPVLPVDTHTYRISRNLGLLNYDMNSRQAHYILDRLIPKDSSYDYHVNCVAHGRKICKSRNQLCYSCCIRQYCEKNGKYRYD